VKDLSPSTAIITRKDQIRSKKCNGIYRSKNHNKVLNKNTHYLQGRTGMDRTIYFNRESVLGLARTGLIFTGLQEGAQPGGGG